MANWAKPTTDSLYADYTAEIVALAMDLVKGLDPALTSVTSTPNDAVRFNRASFKWEKFNGSAWVDLVASYAINITGNSATATKLATARTVSISGDALLSLSFDGSTNVAGSIAVAYVGFQDTRAVNDQPQGRPSFRMSLDFKNNTSVANPPVSAGGGYAHIMTVSGWDASSGSGGWPSQLSFGDGLAIRQATSATAWGAWRTVLTDNNFNSWAPTKTGGGASGTWPIAISGSAGAVGGVALSQLARSEVYTNMDFNALTDSSRLTSVYPTANAPFGTGFYYNLINVRHRGGIDDGNIYGGQIAWGMNGNENRMAFRSQGQGGPGVWSAWYEILNSSTYSNFTVPKTGGVFTGNVVIHAPVAALSLRDTDTAGANIGAYVSLRDSGDVERGWMGFGSNNGFLTIRNSVGDVTISAASGSIRGDAPAGFITGGWFRSEGATGWYSSDYAGGIYMTDASYVQIYNSKGFKVNGTGFAIAMDGAAHDIYGAVNVTRAANSNAYSYYGLVRAGQQTFGIGINTSNRLQFGVAQTAGPEAVISSLVTLDVSGNLTAAGNITANSDERIKTNWRGLADGFLAALAGVKSGVYDRTDINLTQVGVSAQSLREVMPEAVLEDSDGMLSVSYGQAALAAVVELAKEVLALRAVVRGEA